VEKRKGPNLSIISNN